MKKALKYTGIGFLSAIGLLFVSLYTIEMIAQSNTGNPKQSVKENITPSSLYLEVNSIRRDHDLPQLEQSTLLNESARLKCNDMAEHDYYAHENPGTGKQGYSYIFDVGSQHDTRYDRVGENLNIGSFRNARGVTSSWMDSKPHKAAILDPGFNKSGFAVCEKDTVTGNGKTDVFVGHFAKN